MPETYLEAEIATEPDDWRRAADVAHDHADKLPRPGERVAVIGCGTSLYMAQAYASLRESSGQGVTDAWPASEARLQRGYDRIIAITRSGTTTEVIDALGAYEGDATRAVICSSLGTPVLDLADPILIDEVDERSVVQTRFATTTLAILRWHLGEDLAPVIAQAEKALGADPAPRALRAAEQFTFVGMGLGAAIAQECALKMRESCQTWTEAYYATEYRHGPVSISAPGRVVWALGPLVPNFARDIAATGAHLEHDDVDPMADLVRLQRLCVVRAADAGLNPDEPRNLTRSIILEP
ncbi:MAG: sugar isomerase [Actinomycetia bacterium]|nr:sugar isomerase [Actinomycetes bacterium]